MSGIGKAKGNTKGGGGREARTGGPVTLTLWVPLRRPATNLPPTAIVMPRLYTAMPHDCHSQLPLWPHTTSKLWTCFISKNQYNSGEGCSHYGPRIQSVVIGKARQGGWGWLLAGDVPWPGHRPGGGVGRCQSRGVAGPQCLPLSLLCPASAVLCSGPAEITGKMARVNFQLELISHA